MYPSFVIDQEIRKGKHVSTCRSGLAARDEAGQTGKCKEQELAALCPGSMPRSVAAYLPSCVPVYRVNRP